MAPDRVEMIALCGLDCSKCDIYRATSEPQIMKKLLDWFKTERKIDLKPEQAACQGCLGDRSVHWSARAVAQFGSALEWGSRGPAFKCGSPTSLFVEAASGRPAEHRLVR